MTDSSSEGIVWPQALTMGEVYKSPILELVDEPIHILAPVCWDLSPRIVVAEEENGDSLLASNLSISFPDWRDHRPVQTPVPRSARKPADLQLISDELKTTYLETNEYEGFRWAQTYVFRDKVLERDGAPYELRGRIRWRDWQSESLRERLENPEFVQQSNDPLYGRQKFYFQLDHLVSASP